MKTKYFVVIHKWRNGDNTYSVISQDRLKEYVDTEHEVYELDISRLKKIKLVFGFDYE